MATEHGWAIFGESGLYTGWHMTRVGMIAQHVSMLASPVTHGDPEHVNPFALSGRLDEAQKRIWERCKQNGDRAIKIKITYRP